MRLVLLAAAFLFGVLSGFGLPPVFATAASMPVAHAMAMAGQSATLASPCDSAAGQPGAHEAPRSGGAKEVQHCLMACGAACLTLADAYRPVFGPAWFGTLPAHYSPATVLWPGVAPEPPLFPPIAV